MKTPSRKKASFGYSLLVMILVFSVIMIPALAWGAKINALFLIAWIVAIVLCLPLGISYKELQEGVVNNCKKAIVPVMIILCVGALVGTWNAAGTVPIIISFGVQTISPHMFLATAFLLCTLTALVTGTSWGTFGILIPIVVEVFAGTNETMMIISISACMAGAVCGDHCSPISDTTIMASAGGQCNHINHVNTQLPYAVLVAAISFVTYVIAGFVQSAWISLPCGIILTLIAVFVIRQKNGTME